MKTPRQKIIKKLDTLFTKLIMFRDKRTCQHCFKTDRQMHTSHIVHRTNLHLRWNMKNALCMCAYCHVRWWHSQPLEAAAWFKEMHAADNYYLEVEKQKQIKYSTADLEEVYLGLQQVATQTGVI